jgi:hypothetical protein
MAQRTITTGASMNQTVPKFDPVRHLQKMARAGRAVWSPIGRIAGRLNTSMTHELMMVSLYDLMRQRNGLPPMTDEELCYGAGPNDETGSLCAAARWDSLGRPMFRMSSELTARSMMTRYDGLITTDFALPFDTFVIELPLSPVIYFDGHRGKSRITYLQLDTRLVAAAHSVELERLIRATIELNHRIASAQERLTTLSSLEEGFAKQRYYSLNFICESGDGGMMSVGRGDEEAPLRDWMYRSADNKEIELTEVLMNITCGLVMHLAEENQHEPRPFNRSLHETRARRGAANFDPTTWAVGSTIHVDKDTAEAAVARGKGAESAEWAKYASHMVMGHWKNQPHGPGRSERKRIHVSAYLRGNPSTDPREHTYELSGR